MKFNIQSDIFTQKEIEQAMEVLDEETKNLDVEIFIFNDIEYTKKFIKPFYPSESFAQLDDYNYGGSANSHRTENNTFTNFQIFLFEFNLKNNPNLINVPLLKLQMLYNLFHELRHVFQQHFFPNFMIEANKHYIQSSKNPKYSEQWIEIDANYYAWCIMHENKEYFNKLIGYEDWSLNEQPKPCPMKEAQFI